MKNFPEMKNIGQKWFRRSLGLLKVINCCLQLVEAVSAFGRGFELSNLIEQKAEDPSGANRQLKWKQGPWLFSVCRELYYTVIWGF